MTGEPAVKFPKITFAEKLLAFDRVEQSERPLGGLAMKVILDHVEESDGCSFRRKFLSASAGSFACHRPIRPQVIVARIFRG